MKPLYLLVHTRKRTGRPLEIFVSKEIERIRKEEEYREITESPRNIKNIKEEDREREILVCGEYYGGPLAERRGEYWCVDQTIEELQSAGYRARVHLPGVSFARFGRTPATPLALVKNPYNSHIAEDHFLRRDED